MIIRLMGVGQYRLSDDNKGAVNALDDKVTAAAEADDQKAFTDALQALINLIQEVGEALPPDEFVGSDAIVPDLETSPAEALSMASDQGLIPD